MEDWKKDPNKRALAIGRRSSYGQKENTSAETQEREFHSYVKTHGLDLIKIDAIIESAYKADARKKYRALMQYAQSQGIRHILFYIGSREARNLTDNETNERLIKEGKIIIHYVSENKVYFKDSPDSDFLMRDILTSVNKSESRVNGTRVKNACRTKAEMGWFPYRHTPLGYMHHKERDKFGNGIKGTAIVIPDPDHANVKLVQREFELRAHGYSYDVIRQSNLDAGLVPLDQVKTYHRSTIEKRLKNQFYWGTFKLANEPTVYQGKHELIIQAKTLKAVKAINEGHACKVRKTVANGEDVFSGWLMCDHPECQRPFTYDPKTKIIKRTGEKKVYHYYRCSNSRKVHMKLVNISEEKIWDHFEPAVEALTISQEFANDITAALNETHEKQKAAIKKQMEGYRIALKALEGKEDLFYQDYVAGVLDKEGYQRQIKRVRDERDDYNNQLEHLALQISDEAMISVKKVFELAINAKELYKSMSREDRLFYLKKICSNPTLDGLTLQYQLQSPFERLSNWKENSNWRRERDSNPRAPRRAASFQDWCIQPLYHLSVDGFMEFADFFQSIKLLGAPQNAWLLTDFFCSAHIRPKNLRNLYGTIFSLIVF